MTEVTRADCKINIAKKEEDLRTELILGHYSMLLLPAFLLEGCVSIYLKNEVSADEYLDGKPLEMRPLLEVINLYADLFKNEHCVELQHDKLHLLPRIGFFADQDYIEINENDMTVVVKNKEKTFEMVNFFSNLIMPLIDTYLVTLVAIRQICGKNLVLKHSKLVKQLHNCIKVLHMEQIVTNPISCVVEIIETAVFRYAQLGLLETRAYMTNKGNTTLYTQCPAKNRPQIDKLWTQIQKQRNLSEEE